jgi:general secretion pathway protein G
MKPNHNLRPLRRRRKGFTLIEMLVVIAVMSILAGMVFPITKAVSRNKVRARARAEMALLQTAIEAYKLKLGFYPPTTGTQTPREPALL